MRTGKYLLFLGLGLSVAVFGTAYRSHATLGESTNSVESDREALSAVGGAITVHNGYTVHNLNSASTAIREYVSSSGVVFAIAWNGLVYPDLTKLLGSYAAEYEEALKQTPREPGRRHLEVKTDRVVVQKWGHMRNLQGRAYVPGLLPPGVSIDEIK